MNALFSSVNSAFLVRSEFIGPLNQDYLAACVYVGNMHLGSSKVDMILPAILQLELVFHRLPKLPSVAAERGQRGCNRVRIGDNVTAAHWCRPRGR